jgi:D-glycero-D-manno-heptose 1,7-bisphosphate phosphatase
VSVTPIDGRAAVFLDRDGVLNEYLPGDYVKSPAELRLLPGVGRALRALNDAGLPVFLISNQQGVARGLMTAADLEAVDRALRAGLAADGARLDQSYYCPHARAEGCDCRKPLGGMLVRAAYEHGIDLAASFFVGDTETDVQAGRAAGIGRFLLVLTGKHADGEISHFPVPPDSVAPTLTEAVAEILSALRPVVAIR